MATLFFCICCQTANLDPHLITSTHLSVLCRKLRKITKLYQRINCPKAQRAGASSAKTERIPPQKNYCTCLWAQSAQLSQLIKQKPVGILKFAQEKPRERGKKTLRFPNEKNESEKKTAGKTLYKALRSFLIRDGKFLKIKWTQNTKQKPK